MKKKLKFGLSIIMLLMGFFSLVMAPNPVNAATELADGTYTINYTVLHSDNNSASIANDYWEKPAKIIVDGGKMEVQMSINHSSWVKEFKVAHNEGFSEVRVISTDRAADRRVVQFPIRNLSNPLAAKIHVTVTDIDYDHDYTVRLSFDTNSIKTVSLTDGTTNSSNENSSNHTSSHTSNSTNQQSNDNSSKTAMIENPETNDTSMISIFVLLLVVSGTYVVKRMRMQGS